MKAYKHWISKQSKLFSKFGLVGVTAATIDITLFNFFSVFFNVPPIQSKIIAGLISTLIAWMANRYWTFRKYRRSDKILEAIEYFLVAIGGLGISLICLWFSHYVLGFRTILADNISANVIGLFFATIFRFFVNQYWVFGEHRNKN
jgi:putative flippase GtrA